VSLSFVRPKFRNPEFRGSRWASALKSGTSLSTPKISPIIRHTRKQRQIEGN